MLLHDLIEGVADGMKKKRAGIENITIGGEFNHGKMIVHGMIQCLAFQGPLSFCCQLFFKFRVEHKYTPAKKIESSDISSLTNPSHFLGMKRRFECNAPLSFDSGFSIQKTGLIQDDAPFLYTVINKTYSYSELFVRCIDCLTGVCQWARQWFAVVGEQSLMSANTGIQGRGLSVRSDGCLHRWGRARSGKVRHIEVSRSLCPGNLHLSV